MAKKDIVWGLGIGSPAEIQRRLKEDLRYWRKKSNRRGGRSGRRKMTKEEGADHAVEIG